MLQATDLTIAYGAIDAVRGVTLTVEAGEAVCVLGPNGVGKTTLVRALVGWQRPRRGRILFRDTDITTWPSWRRTRGGIGVVPEGGRVFADLTVQENLRATGSDDWERGFELFPALAERRRQLAGSLSGGERQMLALGRALVFSPQLLIVDEASFGLMPQAVEEIFTKLAELRDEGIALLIIEQREDEALQLCSRGYVMGAGRLIAEASSRELASREELRRLYMEGS